jgi:hypothetical protein
MDVKLVVVLLSVKYVTISNPDWLSSSETRVNPKNSLKSTNLNELDARKPLVGSV